MSDIRPLVSICIPTYNRADMVGEAVSSALSQSYSNIEVIVVDNASTDLTGEVISRYTDPRLKYVRNPENVGLFGNFNRCIELAKGEYIHILHSDDRIDPSFTENCMRFFISHLNVWLTFTPAVYISGDIKEKIQCSDHDEVYAAPEGFIRILTERRFIICPTVMAKKALFKTVGKFSCEYPYASDYYHWLTIARTYDIGFVHSAMLYYVQGIHSETYRLLFNDPSGYLDILKIYLRVMADLGNKADKFRTPLNIAIKRFIGDCLYAGITRTDMMNNTRPSFFTGMAVCAWTLIKPEDSIGSVKKVIYRFVIAGIGCIIVISPLRRIIKKFLNKTLY